VSGRDESAQGAFEGPDRDSFDARTRRATGRRAAVRARSPRAEDIDMIQKATQKARNVLGGELAVCSKKPLTGFLRTGCCETGPDDLGVHTVCALMTAEFLDYSRRAGNDLSTPMPEYGFPGLKPGDKWCLCAARWQQAFEAGAAPRVDLAATHAATLEIVRLEDLKQHAIAG